MAPGQSYPSPNAAQVAGSAGPFFGQATDPQIAPDLQQLSQADISRSTAPIMSAASASGADLSAHTPHFHEAKHPNSNDSEQDDHQRLAQNVMNLNNDAHFNPSDNTPTPRKRSKVSRACDECRRKKIRCDATAENSAEPCSSCKRTGVFCQFSRQPMKRGPSKGYIKELADRLHVLEGQFAPAAAALQSQNGHGYVQNLGDDSMVGRLGESNSFSPPPQGSGVSRKRTHSMSEPYGNFARDPAYTPARHGEPWNGDAPRQPGQPQTPRTAASDAIAPRYPAFSPNGHRYSSGVEGAVRPDNAGAPFDESIAAEFDWDEDIVDEYYRIMQPTFPILTQTKGHLHARLSAAPVTVREAFLLALTCAVRSSSVSGIASSDLSAHQNRCKAAASALAVAQFDNANGGSLCGKLTYLQALLLMAIEADAQGQAATRSGPSTNEWLGRAIGEACSLKLDVPPPRGFYADGDSDPDSDSKLGRRLWAIIFIMAHWHAMSGATNDLVPNGSDIFKAYEVESFGDAVFHNARLSRVAGHLNAGIRGAPAAGISALQLLESLKDPLIGELTFFRESVEPLLLDNANIIHASYWHMRLLVLRHCTSTPAASLLVPAAHVATLLTNPQSLMSPLSHHWIVLAAVTLTELLSDDQTRAGAEKSLDDLLDALAIRRELAAQAGNDDTSTSFWDSAVHELITRERAALANSVSKPATAGVSSNKDNVNPKSNGKGGATGLQHLADVAVGGSGNSKAKGSAAAKSDSAIGSSGTSTAANVSAALDDSTTAAFAYTPNGPFDRSVLLEKGYFGELLATLARSG